MHRSPNKQQFWINLISNFMVTYAYIYDHAWLLQFSIIDGQKNDDNTIIIADEIFNFYD